MAIIRYAMDAKKVAAYLFIGCCLLDIARVVYSEPGVMTGRKP